ncbi:hypothetical protein AMTR_s00086p00091890 [Amborella trichopoda]|uniref:Small VCP/p97-interacting protein n=1 Tax=Amborella trichopoda TaxID=13333 RepID=W1P565_AMBTC|nr:hypothetical protein AMTR_s00086p00091890 [Amborella trichopoda]
MGFCLACFTGQSKKEREEEDRVQSSQARAMAAEAAQKRQEQFEKSAAGRAARAQMAAAAKQSNVPNNKGGPVLQVIFIRIFFFLVFLRKWGSSISYGDCLWTSSGYESSGRWDDELCHFLQVINM